LCVHSYVRGERGVHDEYCKVQEQNCALCVWACVLRVRACERVHTTTLYMYVHCCRASRTRSIQASRGLHQAGHPILPRSPFPNHLNPATPHPSTTSRAGILGNVGTSEQSQCQHGVTRYRPIPCERDLGICRQMSKHRHTVRQRPAWYGPQGDTVCASHPDTNYSGRNPQFVGFFVRNVSPLVSVLCLEIARTDIVGILGIVGVGTRVRPHSAHASTLTRRRLSLVTEYLLTEGDDNAA